MSIDRGEHDITLYYADDDNRRLIFTSEDGSGNEVPHDLTAYDDILMQAKARPAYSAKVLVDWSLGDGLKITGTDDNILKVDFTWSRVQALTPVRNYYYDIRFVIDGEVDTLLKGKIQPQNSVTKRP